MIPIPERNRQILQMRKDGVGRHDVARKFKLSPSRIEQIEKRDTFDRSMADRRARVREDIRDADDPERMWPVTDVIDAVGLLAVTKKRLLDHFASVEKQWMSLRELMDMCLDAPVEGMDFMMSPLLRVRGVGKKGFWSVVNGLTRMNLGRCCDEAWQTTLAKVKQEHKVAGATPYSSLG